MGLNDDLAKEFKNISFINQLCMECISPKSIIDEFELMFVLQFVRRTLEYKNFQLSDNLIKNSEIVYTYIVHLYPVDQYPELWI